MDGSGTGTTAMSNELTPGRVISEAFTVAPQEVYSPIVPRKAFDTNNVSLRLVAGTAKIVTVTETKPMNDEETSQLSP